MSLKPRFHLCWRYSAISCVWRARFISRVFFVVIGCMPTKSVVQCPSERCVGVVWSCLFLASSSAIQLSSSCIEDFLFFTWSWCPFTCIHFTLLFVTYCLKGSMNAHSGLIVWIRWFCRIFLEPFCCRRGLCAVESSFPGSWLRDLPPLLCRSCRCLDFHLVCQKISWLSLPWRYS